MSEPCNLWALGTLALGHNVSVRGRITLNIRLFTAILMAFGSDQLVACSSQTHDLLSLADVHKNWVTPITVQGQVTSTGYTYVARATECGSRISSMSASVTVSAEVVDFDTTVTLTLGGHLKSGQLWSLQNRPVANVKSGQNSYTSPTGFPASIFDWSNTSGSVFLFLS